MAVPGDRNESATLTLDFGPVRSRDGFDVVFAVTVNAHVRNSVIDHAAYSETHDHVFLDLALADVAADLERGLCEAVESLGPREVDSWITDPPVAELQKATQRQLFGFGIELVGPIHVSATSPAFEEREALREAADAAKAADGHAESLAVAFEELRRRHPNVPPGKLLSGLPKEEQRPTLLKLFKAEVERDHARLFVAAGTALYSLDDGDITVFAAAAGGLGPIRRLACADISGRPVIACGCRDGVTLQPADAPDAPGVIASGLPADSMSGRGFGGVDLLPSDAGTWLWMSHAGRGVEALLLRGVTAPMPPLRRRAWTAADLAGEPRSVLALTDSRAIVLDSGEVWLASGEDGDATSLANEADTPAVALLSRPSPFQGPLALREDGAIDRAVLDDGAPVAAALTFREALKPATDDRTVIAARAAAWLGDVRIAACLKDGRVTLSGIDDDVLIEYKSSYSGFVEVAASAGRIAALTADRDRLVVWRLDRPDAPEHDVFLTSTTRSRAADLIFVST